MQDLISREKVTDAPPTQHLSAVNHVKKNSCRRVGRQSANASAHVLFGSDSLPLPLSLRVSFSFKREQRAKDFGAMASFKLM